MIIYKRRVKISDIYEKYESIINSEVSIYGWIRSSRTAQAGKLGFIDLTDGSTSDVLNIVFDQTIADFDYIIKEMTTGCSLYCKGILIKSPIGCKQLFELKATDMKILGTIPEADTYPIPKKQLTVQYLRDYCHLRSRTRLFASIFRTRDLLISGMREYFIEQKFTQVDPNIMTISDCEGAGETFTCTSLIKDGKIFTKDDKIDFGEDTFCQQVNLTVSSQLHLEAFCCSLGDVYTMNKSFRAEKSLTNKHVSEFMHVEAELAFISFNDLLDMTEDFTKYCIQYVLKKGINDLIQLDQLNVGLLDKIRKYTKDFTRVKYVDIIKEIHKDYEDKKVYLVTYESFKRLKEKKQKELLLKNIVLDKIPSIGDDLSSAHEKYILQKYDNFVFVTHWPSDIKAFYMLYHETIDDVKYCESFDLLCPNIGEMFGGSMREDDLSRLEIEMYKRDMKSDQLKWYLDLRRYGSIPHGGWGCGFDRFLMFLTGMDNIKDVIPMPVYYKSCKY